MTPGQIEVTSSYCTRRCDMYLVTYELFYFSSTQVITVQMENLRISWRMMSDVVIKRFNHMAYQYGNTRFHLRVHCWTGNHLL